MAGNLLVFRNLSGATQTLALGVIRNEDIDVNGIQIDERTPQHLGASIAIYSPPHRVIMPRIALLLVTASLTSLAASDALSRLGDPTALRGVVVVAAPVTATALADVVRQAPITVLALTSDAGQAQRLRSDLAQADVLGQVAVQPLGADGRVPLLDLTAAAVVCDRGAFPALTAEELQRITRPEGVIQSGSGGSWTTATRARPTGYGDWSHYNSDAANSQHSTDTVVAEPRGLQWIAGPTDQFKFVLIQDAVTVLQFRTVNTPTNGLGLVGRDAFSGMPLWWMQGVNPVNRHALVTAPGRLIVHPAANKKTGPHTVEYDLRTGEQKRVFDQGIAYANGLSAPPVGTKGGSGKPEELPEDLILQLTEGVLVQSDRSQIVAVDDASGKRLWRAACPAGAQWVQPCSGNGLIIVAEGSYLKSTSYTHWPIVTPKRIVAFDLRTGAQRWEYAFPRADQKALHSIYNLQREGSRLSAAVMVGRGAPHALILDHATGTELAWAAADKSTDDIGGHSHVRLHLRHDTAWFCTLGAPNTFFPVADPTKQVPFYSLFGNGKTQPARPVSCTVWRSTPGKWYGGQAMFPWAGGDQKPYFNRSGRSGCDIGSFPGNGLLYAPPNTCPCLPYLTGTKAYHSRLATADIAATARLERGAGTAGTGAPAADSEWGQMLHDPSRRMWAATKLPATLKIAWTQSTAAARAPELLAQQWNTDSLMRAPISAPVFADGLVAVADGARHQVVVRDAATGTERWRRILDGRIDTPPSLAGGMLFVGTRAGSVYACNAKDGQIVWRFIAAPNHDLMTVNGQLESPWPVLGSVTVSSDGLWVMAGRHSDSDNGIRWYILDPVTGAVRSQGRLGHPDSVHFCANRTEKVPLLFAPIQNSLPVLGAQTISLPEAMIRRTPQGFGTAGAQGCPDAGSFLDPSAADKAQMADLVARYGSNAFVGEPDQTGGWSKPIFGNTLARFFAVDPRSKRCIAIGGGLSTRTGRGGGGDSRITAFTLLDQPTKTGTGLRTITVFMKQSWELNDPQFSSGTADLHGVNAMAVCDNRVVVASRIASDGKKAPAAAEAGASRHRLRLINLDDGKVVQEIPLPAAVVDHGIAIAGDRIAVACMNGDLIVFAP